MSDIQLTQAAGIWSVRAGGAILAESSKVIELRESGCDPVIYFPREDVAMVFFDASDKVTHCPKKGAAQHYSIVTKSQRLENTAWSYEAPIAGMEAIRGHVAFYPVDTVTVEEI